jgi:hypothetical protein
MRIPWLLRIITAALCGAASASAMAGYYLGGSIQQGSLEDASSTDSLDRSPGGRLHGGYEVSDTLAVEAAVEGWNHAIEDVSDVDEERMDPGLSFGFRARMPLTERLSLTSLVGVHQWRAEADEESGFFRISSQASGVDTFYTLGTRFRLQEAWELGLERYRYNAGDGFGSRGVFNLTGFRFTASYFPDGRLRGNGGMGLEQVVLRGGIITSLQEATDEYVDDGSSDLTPGVEATVGYLLLPELAFELGYRMLGEAQFDVDPAFTFQPGAPAGFGLAAVRLKGVTAGFAYESWREERLALFLRAGMLSWVAESDYQRAVGTATETAIDPYLGGGLTYQLTDRMAFYADYTRYSADVADSTLRVNALSAGVEYLIGEAPRQTASRTMAAGWRPGRGRLTGSMASDPDWGQSAGAGQVTPDDDADDSARWPDGASGASGEDGGEVTACDPRYRGLFFDCD